MRGQALINDTRNPEESPLEIYCIMEDLGGNPFH